MDSEKAEHSRTSLLLHFVFVIIVAAELIGRLSENISLEYLVKPLIMIWIGGYFLLYKKKQALTVPVLIAFFFSWLGDIFLMFAGNNELFFFAGVGGFFVAQLTYIYIFATFKEKPGKGFLQKNFVWAMPFLIYLAGFYFLLLPSLDGMMKPIILVYALSLIGMSMLALNRKDRVGKRSFQLVFIGSLLFLASDSMIAFNRFYAEFAQAGLWIMITYIAAQYLIMRGLILEK